MSNSLYKILCLNCDMEFAIPEYSQSEWGAVRCSCGSVSLHYLPDGVGKVIEWGSGKGMTAAEAVDELADALKKATIHHPDLIQQRALETWYPVDDVDFFKQKNQAALQLASEGGEVAALWAKFNYKPAFKLLEGMTREETFKANLLDELGDVLYYLAVLAHLYGWTIEDISQHNYEKLRGGHGWKTPSQ